jgi:hypothetical protein
MNIGERYSLHWKHPHRIEAVITALDPAHVVAEATHRCDPPCDLLAMKQQLPLEGVIRYKYADFAQIFQPMAQDALALPPATK